ncbi:uncharacterized protein LOC125514312 [Triticum urartu]|uniref:uncharacterized protein LOC125514312 n=1 Tax=Triticum urartu TaxID=4572 RepID=UPI0020442650|nr:uncharacterized protein LOC125514312 [Triticum urartu]
MSCAAAEAGLVAMDCVVVCCCCPCLVLQITVFLFVRLPRKVVVKSKRVFLRRWHRRRRRSASAAAKRLSRSGSTASSSGMRRLEELLDGDFRATFRDINGGECSGSDGDVRGSWKEKCFAMDDYDGGVGWKQRCFAVDSCDDDGVWEALVGQEGLFWFGSFWGRTEQGDPVSSEDQMYAGLSLPVVLERVRD